MADRKPLGTMVLAKRPCGRVVAAAWVEGAGPDLGKSVARWVERGHIIETVKRYPGDPQPEWVCAKGEPCKCEEAGNG